jgi:hypothetical protein
VNVEVLEMSENFTMSSSSDIESLIILVEESVVGDMSSMETFIGMTLSFFLVALECLLSV